MRTQRAAELGPDIAINPRDTPPDHVEAQARGANSSAPGVRTQPNAEGRAGNARNAGVRQDYRARAGTESEPPIAIDAPHTPPHHACRASRPVLCSFCAGPQLVSHHAGVEGR